MKRLTTRFRFTFPEFVGSLGDLGTLLPLLAGLIVFNGMSSKPALVVLGITYILTSIYYRLPVPVQPLKAVAVIAIATGASIGQLRATALWMAAILLLMSVTKLADRLSAVFPRVLVQGLQLGLGLMMVRSGMKLVLSYPDALAAVTNGVHAGSGVAGLPLSARDFWSALPLLVLPQLPLTLGNSVVATRDCAIRYFGGAGEFATGGRLAATIGLGNLAAGLTGGMPMCHGAGGMTAHYHLGARTGAAGVMLGSVFLAAGVVGGQSTTGVLLSMPAWILGAPLVYVGIRHAMLARESLRKPATLVAVVSMAAVAYFRGDLLAALGVGLAIKLLLQDAPAQVQRMRIPRHAAEQE